MSLPSNDSNRVVLWEGPPSSSSSQPSDYPSSYTIPTPHPPQTIPHFHNVLFTVCGHKFPDYVFDPFPADPSRCICPRTDHVCIPFQEAVPGRSGVIHRVTFGRRIVYGKCRYCVMREEMQRVEVLQIDPGVDYFSFPNIEAPEEGKGEETAKEKKGGGEKKKKKEVRGAPVYICEVM
ncbi:hypothetical protein ABW19_dt0203595 [Dactylella cylindrospora]|nr:hypothetical protein ABW19_dt0203595 [Dactylella cylindrospora]